MLEQHALTSGAKTNNKDKSQALLTYDSSYRMFYKNWTPISWIRNYTNTIHILRQTSELVNGACMLSHFSHVTLRPPIAHQAPRSMGISRQEYWVELPFPPPGDLPDPGIEPMFLSPTLAGELFTTSLQS